MEDLFREILAPISPTSPTSSSPSLPLPFCVSPAQNTATEAGKAVGDPAPQISAGETVAVRSGEEMVMVDLGMNMGMGIEGEQWTTSEMEMQRILESLSEGYEAYHHQQVSDLDLSHDFGWDAFTVPEGLGVF
jgi:hypothetical protein